VDRVVLNAYFRMGHNPGGFRLWWRALTGSDETLENTYLMRMPDADGRPLQPACSRLRQGTRHSGNRLSDRGQRKHDLAEEYLAKTALTQGLFLVLVGRAQAPVWDVKARHHIERKKPMPPAFESRPAHRHAQGYRGVQTFSSSPRRSRPSNLLSGSLRADFLEGRKLPAHRIGDRAKKLRGTFKRSQATGEGVEASGDLTLKACPKFLTERQRQIWRHIIATAPENLLRRLDRDLVSAWCIATDRMREANRKLSTLNDPDELRSCRKELTDSTRLLVSLSAALGFSPSSRPRIRGECEPMTNLAATIRELAEAIMRKREQPG
jgi:phage terminase small subunit